MVDPDTFASLAAACHSDASSNQARRRCCGNGHDGTDRADSNSSALSAACAPERDARTGSDLCICAVGRRTPPRTRRRPTAWNLILIDNSRAFTSFRRMVHELTRVDRDLWDRFMALDEATLQAALGKWLRDGQIRAILEHRDQMAKDIEALVAERSEAAVFVRFPSTPASPPQRAVPSSHDEPDLQAVGGQRLSALNETRGGAGRIGADMDRSSGPPCRI